MHILKHEPVKQMTCILKTYVHFDITDQTGQFVIQFDISDQTGQFVIQYV